MDYLNYVNKLESDEGLFLNELNELKDNYEIKHKKEVYDFINSNRGLIVLLKELHPYLSSNFPNGEFSLMYSIDPEFDSLSNIVVNVKVDRYTFDNGVMKTLRNISFELRPLRQKLDLMVELMLMPALLDKDKIKR
ncbi:hypothetical protein [uncultured Methanobrevibacter sp.]|uniref:hypothetical protein n=1 Tax=uncultured Methanobrevibacter sp. TaxID=253161 RepID=UPI002636FE1B|nr:hypothetical protein [uncultured Methanobrevibacter sp.]